MKSISTLLLLGTLMFAYPSMTLAEKNKIEDEAPVLQNGVIAPVPRSIAYLTSWQLPDNARQLLAELKADAYLLSFARWDEQGIISSSDDIVKKPAKAPGRFTEAYLAWTQLAHASPQTQMIISFGGQDYEDIWDTIGSEAHAEIIANNIAALLSFEFPVYRKAANSSCEKKTCVENSAYQLIGYTQLSGVDFDFEQAKRLTAKQNQQLAFLARRVRELVGNTKSVVLTTYHVGADPISCSDPKVIAGCSYSEAERSSHHGEVLKLLRSTVGIFDFYNVMAYDAGRDFDYKTAMNNYLNAVGSRSKLRLGISINAQWGQLGHFVMPLRENKARVAWGAEQGYGGFFVWALGASTESRSLYSQTIMFNLLVDEAESMLNH